MLDSTPRERQIWTPQTLATATSKNKARTQKKPQKKSNMGRSLIHGFCPDVLCDAKKVFSRCVVRHPSFFLDALYICVFFSISCMPKRVCSWCTGSTQDSLHLCAATFRPRSFSGCITSTKVSILLRVETIGPRFFSWGLVFSSCLKSWT